MISKKFSAPRGTADILPEETVLWQSLENQARQQLSLYGYQEIRTPVFEETGLFARSIGQTSDVVQKQMLTLASQNTTVDQGKELSGLTLRPEGTAAVVRAYIEHRLDTKESLTKLFYISPMFRGERPQKGRLRQFHQIGVEVLGPQTASAYLDAEVIVLAVNLLNSFGIKDFQLKINTLGTREDKCNLAGILRQQLTSEIKNCCPDCQQRYERNVFRILDCKNHSCKAVVARLKLDGSHLSPASQKYFQELCDTLKLLNVTFTVDTKIVRGLDYYTHTVFELTSPSLGSQDALGAGGRYNNLVEDLGGPAADAVGFALGVERMILARPEHQKVAMPAADVFFIVPDEANLNEAARLLEETRRAGIAGDMSYQTASLKSQMRQANKKGAAFALIFGGDEFSRGTATLKDMKEGEQQEVVLNQIVATLLAKLPSRR